MVLVVRPSPRSSRRSFLRSSAGALVAAASVAAWTRPAAASRSWCQVDPVLKIDGQVVDIRLASDAAMLDAATGPIALEIAVPRGSTVDVLATDGGFGFGYRIEIARSDRPTATGQGTAVGAAAYCPASDDRLPVRLELAPRGPGRIAAGVAVGTANAWVAVATG